MNGGNILAYSIITKNSYKQLGSIFLETLNSSLQLPYKSFILVDDSDDESTVRIVKKWCDEHDKELIVTRSRLYGHHKPTRATARQTAIDIFLENFSEEWLMFQDDDCILNDGWWIEAKQYLHNPRVGLIWGLNYDPTPIREQFLKSVGIDHIKYLKSQFEIRGGTHDILLRRKAIEDIFIPPILHIFEDAFIKHWVESKGFKCAILKTGIIHMNPGRDVDLKTLRLMAQWGLTFGFVEPQYKDILYGLFALLRTTAGCPLTILPYIRSDGVKGIGEGFKRFKAKWFYRLFLFIYSFKIKPPKNRYEMLKEYSRIAKLRAERSLN